jgi:hypothetical protein
MRARMHIRLSLMLLEPLLSCLNWHACTKAAEKKIMNIFRSVSIVKRILTVLSEEIFEFT